MAAAPNALAIGIDLGTTYCCVAVFQNDRVDIIPNQGSRTTPSYVAFTATERLVGEEAEKQAVPNPENTIYDAKRLIGRRYDDPQIQEDISHWPFRVRNEGGKPKIEVTYKQEVKVFTPEEISAFLLAKMKKIAEDFLGTKVRNAVITVPAYFNDSQRQATKDAGTIAGLNILGIINEPTAGAIAYGLDKNIKEKQTILVYDLGGGTFDVSILTITNGPRFEVKGTAGDTHLGGEDFDKRMVDYLVRKFTGRFEKDPPLNARSKRRLKNACERAKRALSSCTETSIEIDAFYGSEDFDSKMTRPRFVDLCRDLFQKTIEILEKALEDAHLDKEDIDEVVLLGGSSRIPEIQKLVKDFFNGKRPCQGINPDEAIAYGAAIQAAVLNKDESNVIKDVVLVDVTPLSLGVEIVGNVVERIIERNSRVPVKKSKVFTTIADNQTAVAIKVFEGERPMTWQNHLLGKFDLGGIPPVKKGVPQIVVTFDLDANNILHVTACVEGTSNKKSLRITNDKGRLSAEEIARMIEEAELFDKEDELQRKRIAAKRKLETCAYAMKRVIAASGNKLPRAQHNRVVRECDDVLDWLDHNHLAEMEHFEDRLKELKTTCNPILAKINKSVSSDSDDDDDELD